MYICHTNGSAINSQSTFSFLLQVNVTLRYFYLLVSNGILTLVFQAQVVAIKTDESVTLVHMVRINKEAILVVHPEKCLDQGHFKYFALISVLKNWNF